VEIMQRKRAAKWVRSAEYSLPAICRAGVVAGCRHTRRFGARDLSLAKTDLKVLKASGYWKR
jgi:hypothetical protein